MLNFFKENFEIFAPVDGFFIKISDVPDKIFSQKVIGDGIAIRAVGEIVSSPIDGKIIEIFDTNHVFIIEGKSGVQIIVHIGINTIELQGNGFERLIREGESVKVGDPIIKMDRDEINKKEQDLMVPIIIANMDNVNITKYCDLKYVKRGQDIILKYCVK